MDYRSLTEPPRGLSRGWKGPQGAAWSCSSGAEAGPSPLISRISRRSGSGARLVCYAVSSPPEAARREGPVPGLSCAPVSAACLMEEAVGRRLGGPRCARALGQRALRVEAVALRARPATPAGACFFCRLRDDSSSYMVVRLKEHARAEALHGSAGPLASSCRESLRRPRYSRHTAALLLAWGWGRRGRACAAAQGPSPGSA